MFLGAGIEQLKHSMKRFPMLSPSTSADSHIPIFISFWFVLIVFLNANTSKKTKQKPTKLILFIIKFIGVLLVMICFKSTIL